MQQKEKKTKDTEKGSELIQLLRTLKDHRRKQGRRHPLEKVLLIIIMAIMAGAKSERAIVRFGKNNKKALVRALRIERKEVPERSVIKGVIENIDFKTLQKIFQTWAINVVSVKEKDFVGIDGKALRGTVKNSQNSLQNFMSIVSVFASKRKQVLSSGRIQTKKESEIPSVRELIEMLDLRDVTFTLDALHCQEETVKTIKKSKNHYIIGVKENQKNLFLDIKKDKKEKRKRPIQNGGKK
jgi:hypothetical protein